MICSMAMAQASVNTYPQTVSGSSFSSKLQRPIVLGVESPWTSTKGLTLKSSQLSSRKNVTSSFFVLHVSPFTKAYKKGSTKFGILWQRRVCRRVRCHLEEVSPSREDESTPDGNDTVQFDLNLPRRSALLEFTCNVCKARTQRMINPEAFRRGTVYVQCGGCQAYHQLVDNLNLVKEYHFSATRLHITNCGYHFSFQSSSPLRGFLASAGVQRLVLLILHRVTHDAIVRFERFQVLYIRVYLRLSEVAFFCHCVRRPRLRGMYANLLI